MSFLDRYTKDIGNVRKKKEDIPLNLPSVRTVYRDGKRVEEPFEEPGKTSKKPKKHKPQDYDLTPEQVEEMQLKAAIKDSKQKKKKKPKRVVIHRNKVD